MQLYFHYIIYNNSFVYNSYKKTIRIYINHVIHVSFTFFFLFVNKTDFIHQVKIKKSMNLEVECIAYDFAKYDGIHYAPAMPDSLAATGLRT